MLSSSGSSENIISLLYKKRARGSCALTPEVSIYFLPPLFVGPSASCFEYLLYVLGPRYYELN